MTTNAPTPAEQFYKPVTVRIGTGSKLHSAIVIVDAATGRRTGLQLTCRCPGASNGFAKHRARIVADGHDAANCATRSNHGCSLNVFRPLR